MASFRRPRNLKDMVVRTRLDNPLLNGGFKTCTDLRCQLCRYSSDTESFRSPATGRSYRILGNFSCKTNNCIYLISCDVCHKQYVGETTDLRKRINNHRSSIRTKKDLPVATHFNGNNHRWEDMSIMVIDHDPRWSDTERKQKEKFWMHRLKSFEPHGINKMVDFTRMNTGQY